MQGNRYIALDSLRGIAALTVAGHHLLNYGMPNGSAYLGGGALAVDFFFVLSGFVIAANYAERLGSGMPIKWFMALRLGRIWPLHLALLAAYLALETAHWLFSPQGIMLRAPLTGDHSLGQLALTALFLQSFESQFASGWNGQSWSISVEMWLYLWMALVWRLTGRKAWLVALLGAGLAGYALTQTAHALPMVLNSRVLRGVMGFGLGVCCWKLREQGRAYGLQPGPIAANLIEIAALGLGYCAISYAWDHSATFVLADLAFMAVVLVFAMEGGLLSRLLRSRPFVMLGALSYSIYLTHVLVFARSIDLLRLIGFGKVVPVGGGIVSRQIAASPPVAMALSLGLVAVCIAVSWVTWRWIEQPARDWSRRWVRQRTGPAEAKP